jgi:AcrR family transcriptional regulator
MTHPGLRERKKQRTREAIVDAALRLFEERGFEQTTIADIAEAADIAPRTFFGYFPSKEDVVFADFPQTLETLAERLRGRADEETAIDAIRAWIGALLEERGLHDERELCRKRVIGEAPALAAHNRALMGQVE